MVLGFALVFGIGSVVGMALASGILSVPFVLSSRFARLRRILQILSGAIAAAVGLEIIYGLVASGKLLVMAHG